MVTVSPYCARFIVDFLLILEDSHRFHRCRPDDRTRCNQGSAGRAHLRFCRKPGNYSGKMQSRSCDSSACPRHHSWKPDQSTRRSGRPRPSPDSFLYHPAVSGIFYRAVSPHLDQLAVALATPFDSAGKALQLCCRSTTWFGMSDEYDSHDCS